MRDRSEIPIEPPRMTPSRFNYAMTAEDGKSLFFNFYTLNLVALDPSEAARARRVLEDPSLASTDPENVRLATLLAEKGFLIDERIDEIALCKTLNERSRAATGRLSLTVAPTLRCNFSCSYCYQTGSGATMDDRVANALISFAQKRVADNGALSITWFGGEPLLEISRIERLSRDLLDLSEQKNARYTASIVTNGYLLDRSAVKRLSECRVKSAQITIDGPPDIHDTRRTLKGGGGSFYRIMENIKAACEDLSISLRMNVDQENKHLVSDLIDILDQEELNKRVGLYIGHVLPYTSVCQDVASSCLSNDEFSILGLSTLMELSEKGFTSVFNYPKATDCCCMADSQNAFVVTPGGGLAKCWNNVGQPESETGHLFKPMTPRMEECRRQWLKRDPFNLACKDCVLLPICMGGCPYNYLQRGEPDCHRWKDHLPENLLVYYYFKQLDREVSIAENFTELCDALKAISGE